LVGPPRGPGGPPARAGPTTFERLRVRYCARAAAMTFLR
jgi:hypothetical protein